MKTIKIKAPAKINLSLKVLGKRPDGFHEIESVMQTINLYDYIALSLTHMHNNIVMDGNHEIFHMYGKNIAYKAAEIFFKRMGIRQGINIYVEKNIPISAGLAGGSADAAGVLYGLNKIMEEPFGENTLFEMCEELGSDLNFCFQGGRCLVKGRGEIIEKLPYEATPISLVKPKNLGISTKKAYSAFDSLKEKSTFRNDLEFALLDKYKILKELHNLGLSMSGSGSTFFKEADTLGVKFDRRKFWVKEGLKTVPHGVCEV